MQGIANPRSKLAQSHYSKGRHKKERIGNVSIAWIIRVGATGFEPATYCSQITSSEDPISTI